MLGLKLIHVSKTVPCCEIFDTKQKHLQLQCWPRTYVIRVWHSLESILQFWKYLPEVAWGRWSCHSWWRHQMETFSVLLALCAGNSPVTGEFPSQRPVTRGFDVFFDLCLNKRLSKQSWGPWFETPSRSLWRRCNVRLMIWDACLPRKYDSVQLLVHGFNVCRLFETPWHLRGFVNDHDSEWNG